MLNINSSIKFGVILFLVTILFHNILAARLIFGNSKLQINSDITFKNLEKDHSQLNTIIWKINSCMDNAIITPLNFTSESLPSQGQRWAVQTSYLVK